MNLIAIDETVLMPFFSSATFSSLCYAIVIINYVLFAQISHSLRLINHMQFNLNLILRALFSVYFPFSKEKTISCGLCIINQAMMGSVLLLAIIGPKLTRTN